MLRIKAFRALRPTRALASAVACVPYDVVSRQEAKALAAGNEHSFLHVIRPEIDLPADVGLYDDQVYLKARENLDRLVGAGTLIREQRPALYLYRQVAGEHAQTGLVCCCHIEDYENNLIKKHEHTRKDKEDDRTRHLLALNAQTGPVFLTYRPRTRIGSIVKSTVAGESLYDFVAPDGVRHTVWKIDEAAPFVEAFREVPCAYVADGHHRSASAWRAGRRLRKANPDHHGNEEYNWFLTVLFPADELNILPYNRLIKSLNGLSPDEVLDKLRAAGSLSGTADAQPKRAGTFCFYLGGSWHELELERGSIDRSDPIGSLDVALLQERILEPILGIGDVRTDDRIDFVGGRRGTDELQRRVDSGEWACGISMYPTSIDQLLDVADAGLVMPPKSTWFEPKLRSGLLVHTLDD